jgi:hypothetical protein
LLPCRSPLGIVMTRELSLRIPYYLGLFAIFHGNK